MVSLASWIQKGLVITSLSVNGLRSQLDEIQLLLNNLGIHILALNETQLGRSVAKELTNMTGYQQKRLDRNYNRVVYPCKLDT